MAELKTKQNDGSVQDFLAGVTDEQKRKDSQAVCDLMQEITGAPPKMWGPSIIGFDTFEYKSPRTGRGGNWMVTGFSPRKAAVTLYIMDLFDHKDLLKNLGTFKTGKSCLYIKRLSDVDQKVLRELITTSVKKIKSGDFSL